MVQNIAKFEVLFSFSTECILTIEGNSQIMAWRASTLENYAAIDASNLRSSPSSDSHILQYLGHPKK